MEYCHNIIHQDQPTTNEQLEYQAERTSLIAKLIGDIQHQMNTKGASFAQQYMLPKGLKIYGTKGKKQAIRRLLSFAKGIVLPLFQSKT